MAESDQFDTRAVHAGEPEPRDAATLAVHRSTVWATRGGASYAGITYPRLSNLPNQRAVAAKIAALEGTEAALVTASGMAAISTALLAALGRGGHVLVQDCLYGGTRSFVAEDLPTLGMSFDEIAGDDPASWESAVRPDTRAIYVEALTNPLMQVADHRAVVAFARAHGLIALVDATFASPALFRPAELGYDLVLHSATKYLNGHSDVVAGAVAGSAEAVGRVHRLLNHLGGSLDPEACHLLQRGLKTLGLRVRRQCATAEAVARFLAEHPAVARVHYPGLPDHPQHARAAELFDGFGGMLSFELVGGVAAVERLFDGVRLAMVGPSLGGVETLLTQPARTSHLGLSAEERARMGIGDGLVRMSVGIEAADDVIADLRRALPDGA